MTEDVIDIVGARENNLKNLNVIIPKNQLVAFAGVSGSGKSSLVFETIARESRRQWQDSYPMFLRNKMPHYDRPDVEEIKNLPPSIVVDQKGIGSNSRSTVGTVMDIAPLLRLLFSRIGSPSAGGSMAYSPNHPAGMCPDCTGLGQQYVLQEEKLFDTAKTLNEGAILFSQFSSGWQSHLYQNNPLLDADKKLEDFSNEEWTILKHGSPQSIKIEIHSNNTGRVDRVDYEGVLPRFYRLYLKRDISKLKQTLQEEVLSFAGQLACPSCQGTGLNPQAIASTINGVNILNYQDLPVVEVLPLLQEISNPVGISIARQISQSIERMIEVGIGYLSLSRQTDSLSGGEMQRIKLVRHLGSSLSNVSYIFDEPTAGLHPYDAEKIGRLLLSLRDKHNNILVVEHNSQLIELADHIIELGIGAGRAGGQLVYQGNLTGLKKAQTLTAKVMTEPIQVNQFPKDWAEGFEIQNAHCHNLKNVDVTIPKGVLTMVSGVAGSGKSSLISTEFVNRYPDSIVVNQKPIGTSIRSTPATYIGIMDEIRKLFGKVNKVPASWFSFNSKGACPICKGSGQIVYDMAFADSVQVVCEECGGHRYNPTALSYRYKEKSIEEVMALTVEEALDFFDSAKIHKLLLTLMEVGLGYMTLGQPTSTLSGGEIQRLKLASQLHKEGQIFVLDEPGTGLHGEDIKKLLALFRRLVAQGNSVIAIEHRLDMLAQADWIIDMGPSGGSQGGQIVFEGTPQAILKSEASKTGSYLKRMAKVDKG